MTNPRGAGRLPARLTIVGLGAAGASLAWRLAGTGVPFEVLEPPRNSPRRSPDRTWSSWGAAGPGPFGHLVAASWPRVRLVAPDGGAITADLGSWRYRMLHSADLDRAVRDRLAAVSVPVRERVVDDLAQFGGQVLDTRPVPTPTTGRTLLWQHFLGYRLRARSAAFDPRTVTLMDFRTPQPDGGVAFGYVLPTSPTEALVEYTEFSPTLLSAQEYRQRLGEYLQRSGIGEHEVLGTESGVIPMTDAAFPSSPQARVLRWGANSGSVRPSTGYSFSTLQRQADALAAQVLRGEPLRLPAPHRRRHLLMDSLVLQALATGRLDGARFFVDLFRRNPVQRVLGFLDGSTGPAQDLALMATSPRAAMLRTVLSRTGSLH